MADLSYEFLDAQARQQSIEGRLRGLEQQHYEQRLNLIVAKDEGQMDSVKEQLNALEKDIKALREEQKGVVAEAKA